MEERSSDRIPGLLRVYRERIYSLCLRVLRHPQDAEDAAQEVLLEILEGATRALGIRSFDDWVYRVALHTALDVRKKRARRFHYERFGPLWKESVRETARAHDALHEALSAMDDEHRRLVIRHFFEHCPLAELARESSCSTATIWRKIEEGKSVLKRSLQGAWTVSGSGLEQLLRSTPSSGGLATPVSGAASAKAGLAASAFKNDLSQLGGGLAMAGKGLSQVALVALSLLLLIAGVGAGLLIGRSQRPSDGSESQARKVPKSGMQRKAGALGTSSAAESTSFTRDSKVETAGSLRTEKKALLDRLRHFRELVLASQKDTAENSSEKTIYRLMEEESRALRPDIMAHPQEYLAFLRSPENEAILGEILNIAIVQYRYRVVENRVTMAYGDDPPSEKVSTEILDGILEFLITGTPKQRLTTINALPALDAEGKPDRALMNACLRLILEERDSAVLGQALMHLQSGAPELLGEHVDALARLLETCRLAERSGTSEQDSDVYFLRNTLVNTLVLAQTARTDQLLYETLGEALRNRERELLEAFSRSLTVGTIPRQEEDSFATQLVAAFGNTPDAKDFKNLLGLCFLLPLVKADEVFQGALPLAPTAELKAAIQSAEDSIRKGDRNITRLNQTLQATKE
jgi:RNA polymerase sigma factor (sigma-70 family)